MGLPWETTKSIGRGVGRLALHTTRWIVGSDAQIVSGERPQMQPPVDDKTTEVVVRSGGQPVQDIGSLLRAALSAARDSHSAITPAMVDRNLADQLGVPVEERTVLQIGNLDPEVTSRQETLKTAQGLIEVINISRSINGSTLSQRINAQSAQVDLQGMFRINPWLQIG